MEQGTAVYARNSFASMASKAKEMAERVAELSASGIGWNYRKGHTMSIRDPLEPNLHRRSRNGVSSIYYKHQDTNTTDCRCCAFVLGYGCQCSKERDHSQGSDVCKEEEDEELRCQLG